MRLDTIVPFGRLRSEYECFFRLNPDELKSTSILSVADCPSSFNAECAADGIRVLSLDPLYIHPPEAIRSRFDSVVDDVIGQVQASRQQYVWTNHPDPAELRDCRVRAINGFQFHFSHKGREEGRYLCASLPGIPLADQSVDLVLCSHFLFLYSEHLDTEFHIRSLKECLRAGREVRVFPLVSLDGKRSPHIRPVLASLRSDGIRVEEIPVPYEFQRGANTMIVLQNQ